jgi:hypothetical protein
MASISLYAEAASGKAGIGSREQKVHGFWSLEAVRALSARRRLSDPHNGK